VITQLGETWFAVVLIIAVSDFGYLRDPIALFPYFSSPFSSGSGF
jgi:hypothetical protein